VLLPDINGQFRTVPDKKKAGIIEISGVFGLVRTRQESNKSPKALEIGRFKKSNFEHTLKNTPARVRLPPHGGGDFSRNSSRESVFRQNRPAF
jgi:hypothetical protein